VKEELKENEKILKKYKLLTGLDKMLRYALI
jgi:hypothetical protein